MSLRTRYFSTNTFCKYRKANQHNQRHSLASMISRCVEIWFRMNKSHIKENAYKQAIHLSSLNIRQSFIWQLDAHLYQQRKYECITVFLSHSFKILLSMESTRSSGLWKSISRIGRSYWWSFTRSGWLLRRSYNRTCPVLVPRPSVRASRNFKLVIDGILSILKQNDSHSHEYTLCITWKNT